MMDLVKSNSRPVQGGQIITDLDCLRLAVVHGHCHTGLLSSKGTTDYKMGEPDSVKKLSQQLDQADLMML